MRWSGGILLLGLGLGLVADLGGCSTVPPGASAEIRPPHKPPSPKPAPVRKPADRATPKVEATAMATASPPPPAPPPLRLIGLDEVEARRLIGAPTEVTERSPAVVWHYESAACRLELAFYMDMASQTLRVLTAEAKPKDEQGLSGDACVASVRTAAP